MGQQLLMLGLVLLLGSLCGDARVLPSTAVLVDGHTPPVNESVWLRRCVSDPDCSEGTYCHVPTRRPTLSRCQACRRRNRRCHRDAMCCPGNRCSINACVPAVDRVLSQIILDSDRETSPPSHRGWRKRGSIKQPPSSKGRVGDTCLRSSDCSDTSCCARHFWVRICKPVLQEGQVCTQQRGKGQRGLELFQRCPCGDGLSCRTLGDAPLSTLVPAQPRSAAAKMRLHVCQKSLM